MRFAVHSLCRFLVRSVHKAEDLASVLIEPVLMVLNPVLLLEFFRTSLAKFVEFHF